MAMPTVTEKQNLWNDSAENIENLLNQDSSINVKYKLFVQTKFLKVPVRTATVSA